MARYDAHYVPGWDCHGMPIEIQIEKKYSKDLPVAEVQSCARAYALAQGARQKTDFQRLGVLGDWDHSYLTMAHGNEADELRALGRILEKGYVFRGLKPVNWYFDVVRPWPRQGSNTPTARTRPSTWRFRLPITPPWLWPSAYPTSRPAPLSSGRRRPGLSRPTKP